MVEPMTCSWRKKIRVSSASSTLRVRRSCRETTILPPGRSDRIEWDQVALPTVSITASTLTGSRAPDSKTSWAPSSSARARLASSRLVASTRSPPAPGERDQGGGDAAAGALDQHRVAGLEAALHEQHPVGREPGGRAGRPPPRTTARPAWARGCRAGRRPGRRRCPGGARRAATASGRSSRRRVHDGSLITACTTTSLPSSSTPAASQPRIIGSASSFRPDPPQRPEVVVVERRRP